MHHTTIVFFTINDKKENKVATVEAIKYFNVVELYCSYLLSDFRVKYEKTFSSFHNSQKVRFGK